MQPTDYTISPAEIKALLDYTQLLKDDKYYREDRQSGESNFLFLNTARQLIQFHLKK